MRMIQTLVIVITHEEWLDFVRGISTFIFVISSIFNCVEFDWLSKDSCVVASRNKGCTDKERARFPGSDC
jgi:hypothetical protein